MKKKKLVGRGGPGRNQGRHAFPEELRTVVTSVRLSEERKQLLYDFGSIWLGKQIDSAKIK